MKFDTAVKPLYKDTSFDEDTVMGSSYLEVCAKPLRTVHGERDSRGLD